MTAWYLDAIDPIKVKLPLIGRAARLGGNSSTSKTRPKDQLPLPKNVSGECEANWNNTVIALPLLLTSNQSKLILKK